MTIPLLLALCSSVAASDLDREDRERAGVSWESRGVDQRILWGHRFGSSELVEDPFITPHVDSSTEYGLYRYVYQWKEGGKEPLEFWQVAQKFRVDVGIARRASVYGEFTSAVQAAVDSSTALYSAVDGGAAGGAGAKLRIWNNNRFQLGLGGGFEKSGVYTASPYNALLKLITRVENLVERGEIPTKKDIPTKKEFSRMMFEEASYFDSHGGLHAAWGVHEAVGVWGSGGVAYAKSLAVGGVASDLFAVGGLGLSLDAAPLLPAVPVGMVVSYVGIAPAEPTAGRGKEYRVGLFYTGRHYLDLGVEGAEHVDWADVYAKEDTWQGYASRVTRHYYSARTRVRVYF